MLEMAAALSAGTHPYLTVPSQTQEVRTTLGPNALVAPEQTAVLDTHPKAARRTFLGHYLELANYATTMHRGDFTANDVTGEGSDYLIDRIVVHGDAATLAAAVHAHLHVGADHPGVQVQPAQSNIIPALPAVASELPADADTLTTRADLTWLRVSFGFSAPAAILLVAG